MIKIILWENQLKITFKKIPFEWNSVKFSLLTISMEKEWDAQIESVKLFFVLTKQIFIKSRKNKIKIKSNSYRTVEVVCLLIQKSHFIFNS